MEYYSVLKGTSHQVMKRHRKVICILVTERSQSENCHILHDFNYTAFLTRQNYEMLKILVVARDYRAEEIIGGAQKVFTAVKLLYDTIMMDTCNDIVIKSHSSYNTKSEHSMLHYGLWVIRTCQV